MAKKQDDTPVTYKQCKQAFIKTLDQLSHNKRASDVFLDWVTCVAISFQNACEINGERHEEREKRYHEIRKKYSAEDFNQFPKLLAYMAQAFEKDSYGDFLGEVYMGGGFGNDKAGQFFTPYSISQCMASVNYVKEHVQTTIDQCGYVTIAEPSCGSGGTVVAWLEQMRKGGFNYQTQCLAHCTDIDQRCAYMTYVTLSLLHVPAVVVHGDTLYNETFEVLHTPSLCMQWLKFRRIFTGEAKPTNSTEKAVNAEISADNPVEVEVLPFMKETPKTPVSVPVVAIEADVTLPPKEDVAKYEQMELF